LSHRLILFVPEEDSNLRAASPDLNDELAPDPKVGDGVKGLAVQRLATFCEKPNEDDDLKDRGDTDTADIGQAMVSCCKHSQRDRRELD